MPNISKHQYIYAWNLKLTAYCVVLFTYSNFFLEPRKIFNHD